MDHGSGTLTRDINLRQYALIQTCTKRKPILKSGAVFDAECLFLYKIFKSHFDSLLVALRDHLPGGERAFVKVELVLYMITQFESSINLAMRHLNDSVSPLFRRSDEPSVVLLIILHQDMCALATYLDSELLPYFKTVHTEVIEAVTKEYSLIHAMRRICQLVQDKLTTTIPIIAMRIEEALYAKVSDTVSSVMTKICGPSHFLPPMESDINVLLGEGIVVGCLEPAAVLLERYGEALCAQRVVTIAVKATMDAIVKEIVNSSLKFNDKGIYLLYMQLNCVCAWTQQIKIKFGFNEKFPFLLDKRSLDDANCYLSVLQTAVAARDKGPLCCRPTCLPVLKYNFSNVVAPDLEASGEEGKCPSEQSSSAGFTDRNRALRRALEELVVRKNEGVVKGLLSLLGLGGSRGAVKIFSALRIHSDGL